MYCLAYECFYYYQTLSNHQNEHAHHLIIWSENHSVFTDLHEMVGVSYR